MKQYIRPCREPVPGYLKIHRCCRWANHKTPHYAVICGDGKTGGRRARWANHSDLTITGEGTKGDCTSCTISRTESEDPNIRIMTIQDKSDV